MAFEATHMRFAKDLASILQVKNKTDFYAGSVYPDSRYVTQISRGMTHGVIHLTPKTSDFDKGWFTHILYDQMVGPRYMEHSPWPNMPVSGFGESWVYMTAAKLIEDQRSYEALGEEIRFLQEISHPQVPPNHEDKENLERYYQFLRTLYHQKPLLDGYFQLLQDFSIPADIARSVVTKAGEFSKDAHKVSEIEGFYPSAVQEGMDRMRSMQV